MLGTEGGSQVVSLNQKQSPFWRGSSFYSSVFSASFLSNTAMLGIGFAHALFVARHYAASDISRSNNGAIAAILLGIFFLGICFYRWRARQVLRTHPTDDAVLGEMQSMLSWTINGFCILSILMLHPVA